MQKEITIKQPLLDENGNILNPGFAKSLLWEYDRNAIKAPRWRIKEWDYYYIGTQDFGIALTISDAGFVSSLSISLLTFGENPSQVNDGALGLFPLGKLKLPWTSLEGETKAKVSRFDMEFLVNKDSRHLKGKVRKFGKKDDLVFDIELTNIPKESMVIATPFKKKAHFYYNQKINCMKARGYFRWGEKEYLLDEDNKALGTLDWGRGVWTYDNTWYWGSGQMELEDGNLFGYNIGYGFGDTSAASENMLFYNGTAHKLKDVEFVIPKNSKGKYEFMKPWKFKETDGRFEMDFVPLLDRNSATNIGIIAMIPHQVFGKLSGKAILDDGKVIEVKDKLVFAEVVHNRW